MKKRITAASSIALLFFAAPAWALDMEYHTYGGFTAVVTAFQKIALIFSDAGYQALFFVVIVAAIFLGVMSTWFGAMRGAKVSPLGWAPPILLGVGIYLALVVPKGSLTVYDPLMNRFQTVGNVPNGLVLIAGSLNTIERGLVDIIDTSAAVEGFKTTGGGLGFNMLYQATKGGFGLGNSYIGASMRRYVKDCVLFEITRPGTALTIERIQKTSTDFVSDLADAANPAVYTVYYSDTTPEGSSMSCQAAYASINGYLSNTANLTSVVKEACSAMGFNVSNANELARCRSNMSDFVYYLYNGVLSVGPEAFMRQIGMMEAMDNVLKEDNPDLALQAMSNRGIMTSGMSMGLIANDWLPVMRAVFTAVAIGLVPFICLFIPTGIIGKAASLIAGFFIWLTCWGITDAVMHGIATDYSIQAMEYIRTHNLGYNAVMMFPSYTEKALAMFGFIRTAGIMLATVMTGMLVSFGGHALSMMASNVQGTIQGQASSAGMASADPIGHMQARQQLMNTAMQQGSVNAWDNMGKQRFSSIGEVGELSMQRQFAGVQAQNIHEGHTGMNRMDSLAGQALKGMSTMQAGKGFTSTTDAIGAETVDVGARGKLTYDAAGNLTRAEGSTIGMSDMGRIRSSIATSAIEKLAAHVSRASSQEDAIQHLTNSGFSSQDAKGFTETIKGGTNWGRGTRDSSQTGKENAYQAGVDTNLGVGGNMGALGAKIGMKGNVAETDRAGESRATDKTTGVNYGKDWSKMRDHVERTYFSSETGRSNVQKYAESQGWSDVKEYAQQYSQVKMLESNTQQNTLHKTVESIANEKFGHIADTHTRNYEALKYIETNFGAGSRLGGLSHDSIVGTINERKAGIDAFGQNISAPGTGNIPMGMPKSNTQNNVENQLRVLEQTSGKAPAGGKAPGPGERKVTLPGPNGL